MYFTASQSLLQAALRYASIIGVPVFPVWWPRGDHCACPKGAECESPAKHPIPANGLLAATTDIDQVEDWWRRWPTANIGVRTGLASGLVVVDEDPGHDGDDTLAALEREHEGLPDTPEVATGGGGRHLYFRHPGRPDVRNSAGVLGPGLDVRGTGGYIIAPPSLHVSGRRYEWDAVLPLDEIPLAPLPNWLLELVADNPRTKRAGTWGPRQGDGYAWELLKSPILKGTRNADMLRISGWLRQLLPHDVVVVVLLAINDGRCDPPLPQGEVKGLVDRVFGYSQRGVNGHPRAIINRWKESSVEDA